MQRTPELAYLKRISSLRLGLSDLPLLQNLHLYCCFRGRYEGFAASLHRAAAAAASATATAAATNAVARSNKRRGSYRGTESNAGSDGANEQCQFYLI